MNIGSRTRCLAALALIVLCPPAVSHAAGRPDGHAVQFGISGGVSLTYFSGATLAYITSLSPDMAWRLSLSIDVRDQASRESYIFQDYQHDVDESFDEPDKVYEFAVASQWLRYWDGDASLYAGLGPRLSYTYAEEVNAYPSTWRTDSYGYLTRSYGVGIEACLGTQWMANGWLVVHAEYVTRLTYVHTETTNDRWYTTRDETHEHWTTSLDTITLDSTGVRFGVSAYF